MTDLTQRYFLNLESVSTHLYCSICQDVFDEPQRAPCGHSFCKKCIQQWLKQSKTCPEDRKPFTEKQLHYDFILANIIGDQMVACPFRVKGCEFIDKLERISSHRKSCSFNPDNLPEFMKDLDSSSSSVFENNENYDCEKLPTPAKPSLRMRLFCDEKKREALRSLLESNDKSTHHSLSSSSTNNVWLNKNDVGGRKRRADQVFSLDDSL